MNVFGQELEVSLLLGIWGAVLSTILFVLKLYEVWGQRFKIEVSSITRSCADQGHDISIKNLSAKPVLLEYLELYSKKGWLPFSKESYIWSPEDSWLNARIEPSDKKVYNFNQGNYFSLSGKKVYVRLHFAGRKPFVKKVAG
ncbi:hypothetical protein [Vibrio parahaemolyticus]|uniref:hypothetical protein n=1 Tax=Vibrio parahaemolyticus TaxID=670 RepID=UPI00235E996F|nr:hypothetical protein [Vibrio parahaemolyticus]